MAYATQAQAFPFSSPSPRDPYFVSFAVDAMMIGGFAIVVYFLMRAFPLLAHPKIAYALVVAGNWPHFYCTLERLYGSRETTSAHRYASWIIPPVLIAVMFLAPLFPWGIATPLIATFVVWKVWHFSMQSFGVTLIYAKRGGFKIGKLERRVLAGYIHATFALGLLLYLPMLIPGEIRPAGFDSWKVPHGLILAGKACALGATLVLASLTVRWWKASRSWLPPLFLVPVAAQYFLLLKGPSSVFFPVVGAFHGLQYIFICWVYRSHAEPHEDIPRFTWKWSGSCFAGGLLFTFCTMGFAKIFEVMGASPGLALLIAVAGTNIHHFFADGVLWKLSEKGPSSPAAVFFA